MREIKFRAWDSNEERMLYRSIYDRNWYASPSNDEAGCHTVQGIDPRDRADFELMQYTGLKDKNGKEIYEGDILKPMFNENVYVEYETISASFILVEKVSGLGYSLDPEEVQYEIIGNIYENPEMI